MAQDNQSAKRILFIGGVPVPEIMKKLELENIKIDWPEIQEHSSKMIKNFEKRIKAGRYEGVIVNQRLLTHGAMFAVKNSCKHSKIPVVYAGHVGICSLLSAVKEMATMTGMAARGMYKGR